MKKRICLLFFLVVNIYAGGIQNSGSGISSDNNDIKNSKLESMQLDETVCDKGMYSNCAEYLISKYNQNNNFYSFLPFSEYSTARTDTYTSPDEVLNDIVPDLDDAVEYQGKSIDSIDDLVTTYSKEAFIFSEMELYFKQIQKKYSRVNDLDFVNLLMLSTKTKTKVAILQLKLYENNSLVGYDNEK